MGPVNRRRLLWVLAIGLAAAMVLGLLAMRGDGKRELEGCVSNLKAIDLALDLYDFDHQAFHYTSGRGRLYREGAPSLESRPGLGGSPGNLHPVVAAGYLKSIPTCPAAGRDTYSLGFAYRLGCPGTYTVWCNGKWHARAGIPEDYPRNGRFGTYLNSNTFPAL